MGFKEFMFGSDEDRAKARATLKEMRPKYDRPGSGPAQGMDMNTRKSGEASAARKAKTDADTRKAATTAFNTAQPAASKGGGMSFNGAPKAPAGKTDFGGKTSSAAPKPKAKPAMPAAKAAAPKPKAKPAAKSSGVTFSGNWKGAAPTPMQARGGQKTKETAYQRMMRISKGK